MDNKIKNKGGRGQNGENLAKPNNLVESLENGLNGNNPVQEYVLLDFPEEKLIDIYKCSVIHDWSINKPIKEGTEVLVNFKNSTHSAIALKFGATKTELIPSRDNLLKVESDGEASTDDHEDEYTNDRTSLTDRKGLKRKQKSSHLVKPKKITKVSTPAHRNKQMKYNKSKSKEFMQNFIMQSLHEVQPKNDVTDKKLKDTTIEIKSVNSVSECVNCQVNNEKFSALQNQVDKMSQTMISVHDIVKNIHAVQVKMKDAVIVRPIQNSTPAKIKQDEVISLENDCSLENNQNVLQRQINDQLSTSILEENTSWEQQSTNEILSSSNCANENSRTEVADNSYAHKHLKHSKCDIEVMELVVGSEIYVPKQYYNRFVNTSKSAATLARALLLEVFKMEFLKTCSLFGKTAKGPQGKPTETRQGLYKSAVDTLIDSVLDISKKKGWPENRKDIVKTLGNKLSEIRKEFPN